MSYDTNHHFHLNQYYLVSSNWLLFYSIRSYPIPCNPITLHYIWSDPIRSHPIPSHPLSFDPTQGYTVLFKGRNGQCAHEFILDLRPFKQHGTYILYLPSLSIGHADYLSFVRKKSFPSLPIALNPWSAIVVWLYHLLTILHLLCIYRKQTPSSCLPVSLFVTISLSLSLSLSLSYLYATFRHCGRGCSKAAPGLWIPQPYHELARPRYLTMQPLPLYEEKSW